MTNDPREQRWRELNWRRGLTPDEESELRAWLEAHPQSQADWELETELTRALNRMPEVPVASNFTARVMDAIARESAREERPRRRAWWQVLGRSRWLPRIAFGAVFLTAGLLSVHHVRERQREEVARSVLTISEVASLANPELLEDFDAIRAMGETPPPDEELLALFK